MHANSCNSSGFNRQTFPTYRNIKAAAEAMIKKKNAKIIPTGCKYKKKYYDLTEDMGNNRSKGYGPSLLLFCE